MRRIIDAHPEWWLLLLCAFAWRGVFASVGSGIQYDICHGIRGGALTSTAAWMQLNGVESLRDWGEMTVAMMLPLAVIPARFVAFNSFWHRRYRAMAGFTAGFLGLWLMAGSLAMAFSLLLDRMGLQNPTTTAGMFLLAMVWQRTPLKVSAVRNCHRTAVLAPAGWRAELGCLRFGLSYGIQCVLSCWALMLLSATAEHQPLIMACLTVLMLFERSQWLSDKPILSRLPLLMLVWLVLH